jgi:mevalonate kinase
MKPETVSATAPGKIILFGEHAVVYGRPAIAVPVFDVRAEASIEPRAGAVEIDAVDIARRHDLRDAPSDDPIAAIIRLTCARLGVAPRDFVVHIRSTIPIASGLGSGAAVSVAIVRALSKHFTTEDTEETKKISMSSVARLPDEDISALAYAVEKLHHGTPSGIDNTVIAFEQPVYFIKGQPMESFRVARPFLIAIADTGIASPTKIAVGDVRRAWEADRARYETLFDKIGEIARKARAAIESGEVNRLGALMRNNQILLREIGVSSPDIERLILAATTAGARGAKLSGAGRGGNVIALVSEETRAAVARALLKAGARRVIVTRIGT